MSGGHGETGAGAPRCPYTDCEYHSNCLVISLLKRAPKKGQNCSYYRPSRGKRGKGAKDG